MPLMHTHNLSHPVHCCIVTACQPVTPQHHRHEQGTAGVDDEGPHPLSAKRRIKTDPAQVRMREILFYELARASL
jgi:hypothetical protein